MISFLDVSVGVLHIFMLLSMIGKWSGCPNRLDSAVSAMGKRHCCSFAFRIKSVCMPQSEKTLFLLSFVNMTKVLTA